MVENENSVVVIADLGYGDAGKGSIVDSLARRTGAHTVVRYNGGAQAAHNVITPDGRQHTFAQFGSGSFVPGMHTHLSRFMITHPLAMLAEERHLQAVGIKDAFARTTIDREALVTTPFQQSANRIKELARGDGLHGSCGMGVGETMSDWLSMGREVLFAGDLNNRATILKKLHFIRDAKVSQLESILQAHPDNPNIQAEWKNLTDMGITEAVADMYLHFAGLVKMAGSEHLGRIVNEPGVTIFEGAQGVLLDEWYGFFPYNSWSTLTFKNADILLDECDFNGESLKLGLLRAYATRHGTGPFVSEDARLTEMIPDRHNTDNPWQRQFRVGYLDLVVLRYAKEVCGEIDGLAVTNLDRLDEMPEWRTCNEYEGVADEADAAEFFEQDGERVTGIKVPADPTDLARMERLTRLLMKARPVYKQHEKDKNAYLEMISERLGLPVAMTSSGPTAVEKEYFMDICAKFGRKYPCAGQTRHFVPSGQDQTWRTTFN